MKNHKKTNDTLMSETGSFSERLRKILGHESALDLIPKFKDYGELMAKGIEDLYAHFLNNTHADEANKHTFDSWNELLKDSNLAIISLDKEKNESSINDIIYLRKEECYRIMEMQKREMEFQRFLKELQNGEEK